MSLASNAPTRVLSSNSCIFFRPTPTDRPADTDPSWPLLDRYEVLGELGRGGMGVVYHARDRVLDRPVALKMVLPSHTNSNDGLKRFFDEADAVAKLRHPGVVQIYEVGENNGRPFLVLEFVEGQNLSQRLAAGPLSHADTAQLIRSIADTIDFAHAQGVIHRDLKPANILLQSGATQKRTKTPTSDRSTDSWGRPQVTDFGIAKRLHEQNDLTRTGVVVGTPQYMAPEQAAVDRTDHTPAIDIYSLGAILYECLTGRPPFMGVDGADVILQLRTTEPIPPARLRTGIPRDLETICMKCLERDPRRRYATAGELAADLGRFLNGETIVARPVTVIERFSKWARRQPALAAAVASCFVAIVLLIAGAAVYTIRLRESLAETTYQFDRAERERRRAEANFQKAFAAVKQMLDQVGSDQLSRVPKTEKLRRELLTRALTFYQGFLAERNDDPQLRHATAAAYAKVGDIQQLLGAIPESTAAFQSARELYLQMLTEAPDDFTAKYEAARALIHIGNNKVDHSVGQHAAAVQAFEQGIAELRALPRELTVESSIASASDALARSYRELGRVEECNRWHESACALYHRLVEENPNNRVLELALATARVNWGSRTIGTAQELESVDALREAIDTFRRLVENDPDDCGSRAALSSACNHLSLTLKQVPNSGAQREQLVREAKKHLEAAVALNPVVTEYRQRLAQINSNLIEVLTTIGNLTDVPQLRASSAVLFEQLARELPNDPKIGVDYAIHRFNAGVHHRMRGQRKEAEAQYRGAKDLLEPIVAANPAGRDAAILLSTSERALASLLSDGTQSAEGEALSLRSIERLEKLRAQFPDQFEIDEQLALSYDALNQVLSDLERFQEAIDVGAKAIETGRRLLGQQPENPDRQRSLAGMLYNTALNHYYLNRHADALPLLDRGIDLLEHALSHQPNSPGALRYMSNHHGLRAGVLARLGRDDEAMVELAKMGQRMSDPAVGHSAAVWFASTCLQAATEDPAGPRKNAARRYAAIALNHFQVATSLGAANPGQQDRIAARLLMAEIAPWWQ